MAHDVVRTVIVADDLTGAADSSAGLADHGAIVAVLPWREDGGVALGAALDDTALDVVVVETDTRDCDEVTAAARVRQVARTLLAHRSAEAPAFVVKKIDSVLRGPIAAELAALRDVLAPARTVIAPAFPRLGRLTVDGVQLCDGSPVGSGDVAHVCGVPDAPAVPAGAPLPDIAVSVHDARTAVDLTTLAARIMALDPAPLVVCSAGLLESLASPLAVGAAQRAEGDDPPPPAPGWTLAVSLSPSATAQVDELVATRAHHRVELAIADAVADPVRAGDALAAGIATVLDAPAPAVTAHAPGDAGGLPVLVTLRDAGAVAGVDPTRVRTAVLAACRHAFAALPRPSRVVANGGDAARVVVDAWTLGRLEVGGSLPYGAALVRVEGVALILKSGGFGPTSALAELVDTALRMGTADAHGALAR
jgi:D-threonate/D-erythronate kinase